MIHQRGPATRVAPPNLRRRAGSLCPARRPAWLLWAIRSLERAPEFPKSIAPDTRDKIMFVRWRIFPRNYFALAKRRFLLHDAHRAADPAVGRTDFTAPPRLARRQASRKARSTSAAFVACR